MIKLRKIALLFLTLFFCFSITAIARDLTEIKRSGKIYVGFTNDDLGTINYDLAVEFARYLNVEMIPVNITWDECFMKNGVIPHDLETNASVIYTPDIFRKVDIVCSTFTILEWRRKIFGFAETLNSAELLITDKNSGFRNINDLSGKTVAFMKGTSFETHMAERDSDVNGTIKLLPVSTNEEAKNLILGGKVYGIVLDADEALVFNASNNHRFLIAMPVSSLAKTAWVVEKGNTLRNEVEDFFRTIGSNDVLDKIFSAKFGISYSSYLETVNKIILLEKHKRDLDKIIDDGTLVIGLRERNFIYQKDGRKQFMQALAEEFTNYLGISLDYLVTPSSDRYWQKENGKINRDSAYSPDWFNYIDLAADVFTPASWQESKADFVPVLPSEFTVIAKKGTQIKSSADLINLKGVVAPASVYEELLQKKGLHFSTAPDSLIDDQIKAGTADYTVISDYPFEHTIDPLLEPKISLGKAWLCWALRKDQPKLKAVLQKFVSESAKKGLLRYLMEDPSRADEASFRRYYEMKQPGQYPSVFYGADKGLPQEEIHSIFQDRMGYMWFGTCAGAVRYNGREMKTIGEPGESAANTIFDIRQDSAGLIYLASATGISVIDKDTVAARLFQGTGFNRILVDRSDNKWFSGKNGLYIFTKDKKQRLLNNEYPELPVAVNAIAEDPASGNIYIGTDTGIFLYLSEGDKIKKVSDTGCDRLCISIKRDLFISSPSGISRMRIGKDGGIAPATGSAPLMAQGKDLIEEISVGKDGNIWFVFDSRIIRMNPDNYESSIYDSGNGLNNNRILSAFSDREDNLWVGYNGGLQRVSYNRGIRNFFDTDINSYIKAFLQTANGRIWISSNNGTWYFDKNRNRIFPLVRDSQGTEMFDGDKAVIAKLADGNIVYICRKGMCEIDPVTTLIRRSRIFDKEIASPDGAFVSSRGEIYILSGRNNALYFLKDFNSTPKRITGNLTSGISQLTEYNGRIFGGNDSGIIEIKQGEVISAGETGCKVWSLFISDSTIWAGTDRGLYEGTWDDFKNLEPVSLKDNTVVKSIIAAVDRNYLWLGTNNGIAYFNTDSEKAEFYVDSKDGLSGDEVSPGGLFLDSDNLLWTGTFHGVDNFNFTLAGTSRYQPSCFIERLLMNGKPIVPKQGQVFRYDQNNFVFEITAVSFTNENSTEFEYYIRGTGNDYSSYNKGKEFKAYYNNLPPGRYEFIYKAKGKNNIQSYSQKYIFTIKPAWFNTWLFRIVLLIVITILIYLLYRARVAKIEAQKRRLEELVKVRTRELEVANVEIQAQRDMARGQRDRIAEQKKEITDSIYYAERIQRSLLPQAATLETIIPEHFVLFRPRNIVSGDFYWSFEKGESVYIAAVDCTGHGVPGALMSMLGISFLNEIMIKSGEIAPAEILNNLRESIIRALKQSGHEGEARDGMDLSMISFNKDRTRLSFAGANNPLYIVRDGKLDEIKGDKMPVGIYEKMVPFAGFTWDIKKGDTFYIFSDGYADQFGGPKAKKFMYSGMKKLLVEIGSQPMKEQGRILEETIVKWQGALEQVDDIVVIGIRF